MSSNQTGYLDTLNEVQEQAHAFLTAADVHSVQPGGGDVPPPTPIRKLPRRVVTIALPAPYDEFHVTAWVNFPKALARDLDSKDEARTMAALLAIVQSHDLVDEEGADYPPATERAFWEAISNDVGAAILQAVLGQIGKLDPKPR